MDRHRREAALSFYPMASHFIQHDEQMVPRADLIFCLCCGCASEINWRHQDATFLLHAACCKFTYKAFPARTDLEVYMVMAQLLAEATNVVKFPKKNPLPVPPPPGYG